MDHDTESPGERVVAALERIATACETQNELNRDFMLHVIERDSRYAARENMLEVRARCRRDQVDAVRAALKELGLE